jgi:ABC-type dipeptide/oligopeptide/nickel transport system permease component
MGGHLLRRLALAVPLVLVVSFVTFAVMRILPGDPAMAALGGQVASSESVAEVRRQLGLDDPLYVQYGRFLAGALHGDFGRSLRTGAKVSDEIRATLPATVKLAAGGLAVALLLGVPLGVLAALRRNTWLDWTGTFLATLGMSIPTFWLGLALISLFSFRWGLLPASGQGSWKALILPSLTLGVGGAAIIARMARSSLIEVLGHDYIRTARAKGLRERAIVVRHALRNAAIPVLTTVGLQIGALLSGAVIVETVFARPGIGRLLLQGVQSRDFPLVQGLIFLIATVYVVVNTLVDLLYAWLDPRIRIE